MTTTPLESIPVLTSDCMEDFEPRRFRSPGRHISDIINFMCERQGVYDKRVDKKFDKSVLILGKAVENAYRISKQQRYPSRYLEGGEITKDGIHGTPDIFDFNLSPEDQIKLGLPVQRYRTALEEIKCTRMSTREWDHLSLWRMWVQLMAYCHMTGIPIGRLCVVFWLGTDGQSNYREWLRHFTPFELQSNWITLMSYERLMPPITA